MLYHGYWPLDVTGNPLTECLHHKLAPRNFHLAQECTMFLQAYNPLLPVIWLSLPVIGPRPDWGHLSSSDLPWLGIPLAPKPVQIKLSTTRSSAMKPQPISLQQVSSTSLCLRPWILLCSVPLRTWLSVFDDPLVVAGFKRLQPLRSVSNPRSYLTWHFFKLYWHSLHSNPNNLMHPVAPNCENRS